MTGVRTLRTQDQADSLVNAALARFRRIDAAGVFTVDIVTGEKRVSVAVSLAGLQSIRDWQVVFGRYGEYFEARPLELGARDDHWVEVISGLRAGERYAVTNSYRIKADIGKAGASHDH